LHGDINEDGVIDISDPILLIRGLFLGADFSVQYHPFNPADVNMDGLLDITDAIVLLQYLFLGGAPEFGDSDGNVRGIGKDVPRDDTYYFPINNQSANTDQAAGAEEETVPADTPEAGKAFTPMSCSDTECAKTYMYERPPFEDAAKHADNAKGGVTVTLALYAKDEGDTAGNVCGIKSVSVQAANFSKKYECPDIAYYHIDITLDMPLAHDAQGAKVYTDTDNGKKYTQTEKDFVVETVDCAGNTGRMPINVAVQRYADGSLSETYGGRMPNKPDSEDEMSECEYTGN
jgi:hypothetical protein